MDRLQDIKDRFEEAHYLTVGPSDTNWLISEVDRQRAGRVTDLESVVDYCVKIQVNNDTGLEPLGRIIRFCQGQITALQYVHGEAGA